jgi:hypothetical protein
MQTNKTRHKLLDLQPSPVSHSILGECRCAASFQQSLTKVIQSRDCSHCAGGGTGTHTRLPEVGETHGQGRGTRTSIHLGQATEVRDKPQDICPIRDHAAYAKAKLRTEPMQATGSHAALRRKSAAGRLLRSRLLDVDPNARVPHDPRCKPPLQRLVYQRARPNASKIALAFRILPTS